MHIVIYDDKPGYYGPFESRESGKRYLGDAKGRVVALIRPWALGENTQ